MLPEVWRRPRDLLPLLQIVDRHLEQVLQQDQLRDLVQYLQASRILDSL